MHKINYRNNILPKFLRTIYIHVFKLLVLILCDRAVQGYVYKRLFNSFFKYWTKKNVLLLWLYKANGSQWNEKNLTQCLFYFV